MKYLKTLALLVSLSALASCSQGFEDFPSNLEETLKTKSTEQNDSTGGSKITIVIDEESDTQDIDCTITIP